MYSKNPSDTVFVVWSLLSVENRSRAWVAGQAMGCCCLMSSCQLKPSPMLEQLERVSLMGWLWLQLLHQLWFLLPHPPPLLSVLDISVFWTPDLPLRVADSQVKTKIVCTCHVLLQWLRWLADKCLHCLLSFKSKCHFFVTLLASVLVFFFFKSSVLCSQERRST